MICGVVYPGAVTAFAQVAFHRQANGSLVYDGDTVVGSEHQGPLNPALAERARREVAALGIRGVPVDRVTASGSGLDPDLSPAAAYVQVDRVAEARGLDPSEVGARVDVLAVDRALDGR